MFARAFAVLVVLLGVAFAVVVLMPWTMPRRSMGTLDYSHQQVEHLAWRTGLLAGSDVIFTKGPWGFAYRIFHPETYFTALRAWLLIVVAASLAMFCVALRLFEPSRPNDRSIPRTLACTISLWIGALLWVVTLVIACEVRLPLILNLGAILLLAMSAPGADVRLPRPAGRSCVDAIARHLLVVSMALGALIKFTIFATSTFAVLIVALDDVVRRRRAPWIAVTYLVSLALFWRIAGHPWDLVVPYLSSEIEISKGYARAMSHYPPNVAFDLLGFIVPAGLTLMLVFLTGWRRQGWRSLIVSLGLAGVVFIIFKSAYVRHLSHFGIALAFLIPLAWIWLPWIWREWPPPNRMGVRVACVLLAVACVTSAFLLFRQRGSMSFAARTIETLEKLPLHLRRALSPLQAWQELRTEYELRMSQIKRLTPLPALRGTVDVYPVRQSVIVAHDLPYAPRPIFQSYSAYTPVLAKLNADHLLTRRAAETILFDVRTIDNRYPSLDDGLSWPRLLALYDLQEVAEDFLVLHRSSAPRATQLEPLSTLTTRFGQPLSLPPGNELLWAEIDLDPTLAGQWLALLDKPPLVTIQIVIPGRPQRFFRLVPDMARAGFLLSPLVEDRDAWRSLADGSWPRELSDRRLTSITLSAGDFGSAYYRDQIVVRLFSLVIDR
jgi:hypothetical protein